MPGELFLPPNPELRLIPRHNPRDERSFESLPTSGRWRVTGVAGSGVSSLIADTAINQIQRGVDPAGLVVVTSSKEAASRLRSEITNQLLAEGDQGRFVTDATLVRSVHSLAFALLRDSPGGSDIRLISGAEQDSAIRDLLAGQAEAGTGSWPSEVRPALGMVGFARQLRDFLLRAAERGLGSEQLLDIGQREGEAMWSAAGDFLREYEQVMALSGARSYSASELVSAALRAIERHPELIAGRFHTLLIDDAQALDPTSARFLDRLAHTCELTVIAGDLQQSVFHFRGADETYLKTTPVDHELHFEHSYRHPHLRVDCVESPGAEQAVVINAVRRAHLIDGVDWSDIAVVVRSAGMLEQVRRILLSGGVPVHVNATDVVLSQQRIIAAIILGIRALDDDLSPAELEELALGPVGGADPVTLRRLLRGLRRFDLDRRALDTLADLVLPTRNGPSIDEVAEVLTDREVEILRRIRDVLAAAATQRDAGGSVEEVLWALWQATGLAERYSAIALRGGAAGSQADRELDAMMTLFDAAGDFVERRPGAGVDTFIASIAEQDLPTGVRDRRGAIPDAVTVLTAHATLGRQWRRVVVTGVHDDVWPALGETGSLFNQEAFVDLVDRDVDPGVPVARTTERIAEERRLFHVVLTRATEDVLITAVDDPDGDVGLEPSRFITALIDGQGSENSDGAVTVVHTPEETTTARGEEDVPDLSSAPVLTEPQIVAELRRVVCNTRLQQSRRNLAARQLARLAEAGIRAAEPARWWPTTTASSTETLLKEEHAGDEASVVHLSPSKIEGLSTCPLRAGLERLAEGEATGLPLVRGTLVHAFAEALEHPEGVDAARATEMVAAAYEKLIDVPTWQREYTLSSFSYLLERTRQWIENRQAGFPAVGVEMDVDVVVTDNIAIRGRIDRLDSDGQAVHVIDLKTARDAISADQAKNHLQLMSYQAALSRGEISQGRVTDGTEHPERGSASLVYPGSKNASIPVREQPPKTEEELADFIATLPGLVADARGPRLRARPNAGCSSCPVRVMCPAQPEGQAISHA